LSENAGLKSRKIIVPDTCVLINDPEAINHFQEHDVVLHGSAVLGELDKKKYDPETAYEARHAIRSIDEYAKRGSVHDGILTPGGGNYYVSFTKDEDFRYLPVGLEQKNDNRIILLAKLLQMKNPGRQVIFVSNDVLPRNTANACGIKAEEHKYVHVERLYAGTINIELVECKENLINRLFKEGLVSAEDIILASGIKEELLIPNLGCYLSFGQQSALAIFKKGDGLFRLVRGFDEKTKAKANFIPKNAEQIFAHYMLMDPKIITVALSGPAGTGKTTLAIDAGYKSVPKHYELMHIFRPTQELGEKQGYLPGTLTKKFEPWTTPIYDAFDTICNFKKEDIKDSGKVGINNREERVNRHVQDLVSAGQLKMSPINHLQGCNLRDQYVIVDEPQNFKQEDMKKIASRPAGAAKLVLTGDPDQIAKAHMDAKSNGFVWLIDRYKGQEEFAHLLLQKKVFRGRHAEMANELLG